ncbi:MAG: methylenetetrahydrofolate--tRNA-(uracil(54)-C(5))-methyltransferase (FADH(2)-oxidizing) TrmFO [Peptococcaceae bacterium]|nr:methylenetetrahydrofolate--tRNA-(uracil(54)-C(5))-methyltransferase (FADH(2)-oxidizing) TrmFO [Peptococcaceae bacterium]MBQ2860721.1 methylenetetrahydrofolate--tRNA-(uracil(54)-C(5))-methyltransferase (FADH(2)-oxidizing) TrmFO [Peptococcaceae bacterium]
MNQNNSQTNKQQAKKVNIIGAGLAGSEAAWQLIQRGIPVRLYEMRPKKYSPAHHTDNFGELVCSNSLRANNIENAVGLLKEELRRMDSLIMRCADENQVPAGGALAVDREKFSSQITQILTSHPLVEVIYEEVTEIPEDEITIIATGPLTDGAMAEYVKQATSQDDLYFYDAAAPIVTAESINYDKAFWASRYDKGDADYLNCPMTEEEYNAFYDALISAEVIETKEFEKAKFFEGCMPIEAMASRGRQTLLFGPMKPVGLIDHRYEEKEFYAVVQLRKDNQEGTLFNIVGFQSRMKWGEQKRVLQMIPGLENAEIVRYGVMHRNTFVNAPISLEATCRIKSKERVFLAGQITGVEGYVESTASGLVAGINAARMYQEQELVTFPVTTAIGGLQNYIVTADSKSFQPMNVNFSLIPPLEGKKIRNKKEKNAIIAQRALDDLAAFLDAEQL